MNPDDRRLIVAIGQAARTCAMYRELLEVARRYQHQAEVDRLAASLAESDSTLAGLISRALNDNDTQPAPAEPDEAAEGEVEDGNGDGSPDA
jgi:hypothetical protein